MEDKPSKGPWILVGIVFLLLATLWAGFILFAERHKPESIPLPDHRHHPADPSPAQ